MLVSFLYNYGIESEETEDGILVFEDNTSFYRAKVLINAPILGEFSYTIPVQDGIVEMFKISILEDLPFSMKIEKRFFLAFSMTDTRKFPTLSEAEDYLEESDQTHKLEVI